MLACSLALVGLFASKFNYPQDWVITYKQSVEEKTTVFPLKGAQGIQRCIRGLYVSWGSVSIFLLFFSLSPTVV